MDADRVLVLWGYLSIRYFINSFIWELRRWCNYWRLSSCRYVVNVFAGTCIYSCVFFAVLILNLIWGCYSSWWVVVFFSLSLAQVDTISVAVEEMLQWSFSFLKCQSFHLCIFLFSNPQYFFSFNSSVLYIISWFSLLLLRYKEKRFFGDTWLCGLNLPITDVNPCQGGFHHILQGR